MYVQDTTTTYLQSRASLVIFVGNEIDGERRERKKERKKEREKKRELGLAGSICRLGTRPD